LAFRTTWTCAAALLLASPAWSQNVLYSVPGAPHERLGTHAAAAGDVDGDGVGDVIVGTATHEEVHSGPDGSLLLTLGGDRSGNVSGAGDVNGDGHADLIVGDPSSDAGGLLSGVITVYSGADGQVLYTIPGAPSDLLGSAVCGVGDVNGDGFGDLAAGATIFLGTAGYVTVFSGRDASVLHTLNPGLQSFGSALASAGDLDGDGTADLLVGAPLDNFKGSVSAYSLATGRLLYTIRESQNQDAFGTVVGGGGDVNDDQVPDFIVGAPQGPGSGSVAYARVCSGADGKTLFKLEGDAKDNISDLYAMSVSHAGDANGDGFDDFVVGAPVEDKGHVDCGRAWLYSGRSQSVLYAFDGQAAGDQLGTSLALIPDIDGDGRADLLVGAAMDDTAGPDAGRAFVFAGNDLYHLAQPHEVATGENLKHRTSEGTPGAPTILVVTAVSGVPTFLIVGGIGFFDGSGSRVISVTVPPGLSGLTITHRAFALSPVGFVIDSADEIVTFL
jgi:hypothetical protein